MNVAPGVVTLKWDNLAKRLWATFAFIETDDLKILFIPSAHIDFPKPVTRTSTNRAITIDEEVLWHITVTQPQKSVFRKLKLLFTVNKILQVFSWVRASAIVQLGVYCINILQSFLVSRSYWRYNIACSEPMRYGLRLIKKLLHFLLLPQ